MQNTPMPDVLIIGYGNPLRRDDGVGWSIVEWFDNNLHDDRIEANAYHQLTPDLAQEISLAKVVIFVDAEEGGEPGASSIHTVKAEAITSSAFTHHITPSVLLSISQSLYGKHPKAFLAALCGEDFGFGEGLSHKVEVEIPLLAMRIKELALQELLVL
jgi:hydrogenase maturation protease